MPLYYFQIWPPGGATCITTLPWIALLASSVSIELVSSSSRVTSVKSQKGLVVSDTQTHRSDLRCLVPIKNTSGFKIKYGMCSNWISLPERSSIAQLPFRLASSPRPVTLAEGFPITMIFSELNESFNLSVVPVKSLLHYFTQFHVFKTTYWLWCSVWNVMWKKGQYVVVMMTMAMMVMMVVIMIVILGTWRCDRWSRSIYSMLTVTCSDHIIIQWWKSKWQGPAHSFLWNWGF